MTEIAQQQQHGGAGGVSKDQGLKLNSKGDSAVVSVDSSSPSPPPLRQLVGFRKLGTMWHPHVYQQSPPTGPTPFSIDDILNGRYARNITSVLI